MFLSNVKRFLWFSFLYSGPRSIESANSADNFIQLQKLRKKVINLIISKKCLLKLIRLLKLIPVGRVAPSSAFFVRLDFRAISAIVIAESGCYWRSEPPFRPLNATRVPS